MEESEAIARLKRGDVRGLDSLVVQYQLRAIRAAYLIVHDRALAEDIVQAAFVRSYQRIDQFDPSRPFGPWFLRGVVNDAITAATRAARLTPLDQQYPDSRPGLDHCPGPEVLLEAAETRSEVWRLVCALPPQQRAAIVMRYYLDLSEDEMAAQLGAPRGTVKWRLHTARKRLREMLPGWLQPGGAEDGIHVRPAPARPAAEEKER